MSPTDVKKKVRSYPTKWDEAISDAKRKIRGLNETVAFYKLRKKAGDQWPEPATHN